MKAQSSSLISRAILGHSGTREAMRWLAKEIVKQAEAVALRHSHCDDDMGAIIARDIRQHFENF